jgi:hypothetical protein
MTAERNFSAMPHLCDHPTGLLGLISHSISNNALGLSVLAGDAKGTLAADVMVLRFCAQDFPRAAAANAPGAWLSATIFRALAAL